jgi:hypothetical protein
MKLVHLWDYDDRQHHEEQNMAEDKVCREHAEFRDLAEELTCRLGN